MKDYLKRCWAVVELDSIAHNVEMIKRTLSPDCMLMSVVKADAYGHGDKYVAGELARLGVDWFGVSNIDEAVSLRTQGVTHPVLVFGATPCGCADALSRYNITQTVHSASYAKELQAAAKAAGVKLNVHVKTDTGMSRLGFVLDSGLEERSIAEMLELAGYTNLRAQGIYTHFACADEAAEASAIYTKTQYERFQRVIRELEARGLSFEIKHCCNSAGTVMYPEMHMDMVRTGIMLYGLLPSRDCAGKIDLKPAMELYSVVSMVKEIEAGASVSYGRTYTADRKTKVATVPIGYADGFGRELSGKARMLVRGSYASVIGRVCMDQLMLDVTHIDGVKEGDVVTIVGSDRSSSLTFDEMAELSGTINYEKVCLVSRRVPRVYRRGGRDIGVVDYVRGERYTHIV